MLRVSKKVSWEIIKRIFLPLIIFLLFLSAYVFYRLEITPLISSESYRIFQKYILSIFIVCIAFAVQRVTGAILAWYRVNIASKTQTELDDQLIPLFSRSIKTAIWIVAFLIILPFYGINITALVAALGVGSLAIALAAQDTIANIIAGFLIMIDAPFRIGDRIKLPSGEVVEVLDIGVRRSKFLSEDKAVIIVPNVDLSKNKIVNYNYKEIKA